MRTIYRYPVPLEDAPRRSGSRAERRSSPSGPWALVDPTAASQPRRFQVYGTGHRVPEETGRYVGTVLDARGGPRLVWHVFEDPAP